MLTHDEIFDTVRELNVRISDKAKFDHHRFEVSTDGISSIISFAGMVLWCDDEDDRPYNEVLDEFEPLTKYIRRRAVEELNNLIDVSEALL